MSQWGILKAEPCVDFGVDEDMAALMDCQKLGSNHDKFQLCEVGWCLIGLKKHQWHPSIARLQQSIVQQITQCLKGPECSVYNGYGDRKVVTTDMLDLTSKTFNTSEATHNRLNNIVVEDPLAKYTYDKSELLLFKDTHICDNRKTSYTDTQGCLPHTLDWSNGLDNSDVRDEKVFACYCRDPLYWRLGEQLACCADQACELDSQDTEEERKAPQYRAVYGGPVAFLATETEMTLPQLQYHHSLRLFAYCQRISDSTALLGDGFGYCNSGVMVATPSFVSPLHETQLDLPLSLCCCVRLTKWSKSIQKYAKYVIKALGDVCHLTSSCISRVCTSVACNIAENLVRAIRIAEYSVACIQKSLPTVIGPDPYLPSVKRDLKMYFISQCILGEQDQVDQNTPPRIDITQALQNAMSTRDILVDFGSGVDGLHEFLLAQNVQVDRSDLLIYLYQHLKLQRDESWNHNVIVYVISNYTEVLNTLQNLQEFIPAAQLLTVTSSWNPRILVHTYQCVQRSLFPFLSDLILSSATAVSLSSPQLKPWVSAFSTDVSNLSKAYTIAVRAQTSTWAMATKEQEMLQLQTYIASLSVNATLPGEQIVHILKQPQYTDILGSLLQLPVVHHTLGSVIDMFLISPPMLAKLVQTSKTISIPYTWEYYSNQKKDIQSQAHTCETQYQSWGAQVKQRFSYLYVSLPSHVQQELHQFEIEMTAKAHKEISKIDTQVQQQQRELRRQAANPEVHQAKIEHQKTSLRQNDKTCSFWKEMVMVGPLLWAVLFQYDSVANGLFFSTGYALPNIAYYSYRNKEFSEQKSVYRDRLRLFDIQLRNISDEANEAVEDYIFACDVIESDPRMYLSNWSHIGHGAFGAVFAALVVNPLPDCLGYDIDTVNVRLNPALSLDNSMARKVIANTPDHSREGSFSSISEDASGIIYNPYQNNINIDGEGSLSPDSSNLTVLSNVLSDTSIVSSKKPENSWNRFVAWIGLDTKKPVNAGGNEYVAVKQIDQKTPEGRVACRRETQTLRKSLRHPNIVRYRGTFMHDDSMWICMSLCDGGTLSSLAKHNAITEPCIAYISAEIQKAQSHLHSLNKIHRDIKPSNVLLHVDGSVVLGDLGLAVDFDPYSTRTSIAGTEQYQSPEMIRGLGYNTKTDIWSLGCVLLELCNGPTNQEEQTTTLTCLYTLGVCDPPALIEPEKWSVQLRDFLSLCLDRNAQKRASADELLQHNFLANALQKNELVALFSHIALDKALKAVGLV